MNAVFKGQVRMDAAELRSRQVAVIEYDLGKIKGGGIIAVLGMIGRQAERHAGQHGCLVAVQ